MSGPGLVPLVGAAGVVLVALGLLPPLGLLNASRPATATARAATVTTIGAGWAGCCWCRCWWSCWSSRPPLGSYAVSSRSVIPGGGDGQFPPLTAPVRGAVPMSMAEFETRAVRDPSQSLAGVRVRLVGFAAPAEGDAGGYRLTRFVIFCCAADAEALQAVVAGDPTPRARDQWLEVEGTWVPRPAAVDDPSPPPPVLKADLVHPVTQPRPPYEYSVQFSG